MCPSVSISASNNLPSHCCLSDCSDSSHRADEEPSPAASPWPGLTMQVLKVLHCTDPRRTPTSQSYTQQSYLEVAMTDMQHRAPGHMSGHAGGWGRGPETVINLGGSGSRQATGEYTVCSDCGDSRTGGNTAGCHQVLVASTAVVCFTTAMPARKLSSSEKSGGGNSCLDVNSGPWLGIIHDVSTKLAKPTYHSSSLNLSNRRTSLNHLSHSPLRDSEFQLCTKEVQTPKPFAERPWVRCPASDPLHLTS